MMESSFLDRKTSFTTVQRNFVSNLKKKYMRQDIRRIKINAALKFKKTNCSYISNKSWLNFLNSSNLESSTFDVSTKYNKTLEKNKTTGGFYINDQERFLKEVELKKKNGKIFKLTSSREIKLLKIKENIELLKSLRISKTTNVYKTVKKRNYLQIKQAEAKSAEIMFENDGTEYYISSRTKRKRKKIDYVSMDHGLFGEEFDEPSPKKAKLTSKELDEPSTNISADDTDEKKDMVVNDNKTSPRSKRGRWSKKAKNEDADSINIDTTDKQVKCGVCDLNMDLTAWAYHKQRYHNNLAWRVGEQPLDLNDEALVMKILGDLYRKRKPLYCEKCNVSKKSVVGFLSHRSMCQKSDEEMENAKVKCENCDRKLLPVSFVTHIKFCNGNNSKTFNNENECEDEAQNNSKIPDPPKRGRKKKIKTAIDEEKIQNIDEENETMTMDVENRKIKKDEEFLENSNEYRDIVENVEVQIHEEDKMSDTVEDALQPMSKKEMILQKIKSENQTKKVFTSLFAQIGNEAMTSCTKSEIPRPACTPRRGRQPKCLVKKENDRIDDNSNEPRQFVECAVCTSEVEQKDWPFHKLRRHNNLAWKTGDPPIDLNDHATVVHILNDIYKRRKPLYCEKCDTPKKSVMGYLSHKSVCQKSEEEKRDLRIMCEYCDRKLMPVSMPTHLKYCRVINEKKFPSKDPEIIIKHKKRSAAAKAQRFIEEVSKQNVVDFEKADVTNNDINPPGKRGKKPDFFKCSTVVPSLPIRPYKEELKITGFIECKFANCDFETDDLQMFFKHTASCSHKPKEGYLCKICLTNLDSYESAIEHVFDHKNFKRNNKKLEKTDEGVDDSSDSGSDNEESKTETHLSSFSYKNPRNVHFLFKTMVASYGKAKSIGFPLAYGWTLNFCEENFTLTNLFPSFVPTRSKWITVSPVLISQYLPPLKYSCSVARKIVRSFHSPPKLNNDWKRFLLFESQLFEDGSSMFFCGGPVFALAWAPTPIDKPECDQYLAVATINKVEVFKPSKVNCEPGLIQIWNCGRLINNNKIESKPELGFCIAHHYGTVMSMEWCPSGCYDSEQLENDSEKLERLGLLAVACCDSNIYIYSITKPSSLSPGSKVFKPKPTLKLQLVKPEFFAFSSEVTLPTKMSWTKARGHQYLAAGYTNGTVVIFDLQTESQLLKEEDEAVEGYKIYPYQVIKAHCFAVTGIGLFHLNGGRRWLMTTSFDRCCKFWDLDNPSVPLYENRRFLLTDAIWLTNWLCSVTTPDDAGFSTKCLTGLNLVANYGWGQVNAYRNNARANTVSGNDWNNSFIQGCTTGEVMVSVHKQLQYMMDIDKREKKLINFPISYVRLIDKATSGGDEKLSMIKKEVVNKENNNDKMDVENGNNSDNIALKYEKAAQKYGIVFCDFPMDSSCRLDSSATFPEPTVKSYSVYPLSSVSKCSYNPNRQSYSYFACGYQAGFVKISYFQLKDS